MQPAAFARTTGPRRPPPSGGAGPYAPVPRALRLASAAAAVGAVAAAAILWLAELSADGAALPAGGLAGISLVLTLILAGVGVPLLFLGPLGKYLSPPERRAGVAVAAAFPVLCWVVASWTAIAALFD